MKIVIAIDVPTTITDSIDVHLLCDDLQEAIKQHVAFFKKDWRENEESACSGAEGLDAKGWADETLALIDEMYNSVTTTVWGNKLEIEIEEDKH